MTCPNAILISTLCIVISATAQDDSTFSALRHNSTHPTIPVRSFRSQDLLRTPGRSLEYLLPIVPGIASVNGGLHPRGSRNGELEYRFGGISVLNRWSNLPGIPFLPEMLEQVDVHTGAYGVGLGSAGGGVVDMKLKEGGESWSASAAILTDDFAKPGETFLDTYSYGHKTIVATLGGSLPFETKFFLAGERWRATNAQPTYLAPMKYDLVQDQFYGSSNTGNPLPETFRILTNHVPAQSAERTVMQFNVSNASLGPTLRFFGSISSAKKRDVTWPSAVRSYFRLRRLPSLNDATTFVAGEASFDVSESIQTEGSAAYYERREVTSDPDFGETWWNYVDSLENAKKGYLGFYDRYTIYPNGYSTIYYFSFDHQSNPNNSFRKESQRVWTLKGRIAAKITPHWKMEAIGESEWWTLRKFQIQSISSLRTNLDGWPYDGRISATFASPYEARVKQKRWGNTASFGYDFGGNEIDDGYDEPRRPWIASMSLENTVTEDRVTWAFGGQAKWLSNDIPYMPNNDTSNSNDPYPPMNWDLDVIDESKLRRTSTEAYVLPRASVHYNGESFETWIRAGAFAEHMPFNLLQIDNIAYSSLLHPWRRVPYNLGGNLVTSSASASRTTQIEAAMEWKPAQWLTLSAELYHKRMSRQIRMGYIKVDQSDDIIVGWVNSGQSSAKGIEVNLKAESPVGLSAHVGYSLSDVRGNGSSPRANRQEYTDGPAPLPAYLFPANHLQTHRIIGDIRLDGREESWLSGAHVWLTGRFLSGIPYTKEQENPFWLGSSTPWLIGVRPIIDVRGQVQVESPHNSRTPWTSTIDLYLGYDVSFGFATATVFAMATNIFDTKNVLNVYPRTGSSTSDGWLTSAYAQSYRGIPMYEEFYRKMILENRYGYMYATGYDMISPPRQIQFGIRVGM